MKRTQRRLGSLAVRLAAGLMFVAFAAGALAQAGPPAKPDKAKGTPRAPVESRVREQIAAQGQATFWVVLREQADLKPAHRIWDWKARGTFVHENLRGVANRTQQGLQNLLRNRGVNFKPVWIINAIHVTADQGTLEEIAARPEVKEIIAVRTYSIPTPIRGQPQPGVNGIEWGVDRVKAPQVWQDFGVHGEGIVVCNIDTGVQYDHPALVNQYRGNVGGGNFDHNYNWYDPSMICGSPSLVPCDNAGHGTHTMGTMVGDDGGDNQIGVAPGARWIAAKGCESSSCSGFALTACAEWILAPTDLNGNNPRPDLRPNIVNNSWGGGQGDPWYQSLVQAWVAAGIWPSFSIGNSGSSCWSANSPGDYPESYAAGAFDVNENIAWFSSRGPSYFTVDGFNIIKPNIAAPGVDVRSSVPGNGYDWYSGTSMASPHVAGTVALLWSAAPALIGDMPNTRALLDLTAINTSDTSCGGGPDNNNIWGEGKLDIWAAVSQAPIGDTGALQGAVTDAVTGTAIAGVTVQVAGPLNRTTLTDASGLYQFPLLSVGSYDLTATLFGYAGQTLKVEILKDQTTVQDIALQPLPTYGVSGSVLDSRGQPVFGATVTILNTPIPPATTAADGSYSFASVPAGEYDVQAVGCGHCDDSVTQHLVLSGPVTGLDFILPVRLDGFCYWCTVVAPAYIEANTDIGLYGDDSYSQVNLPFPFTFYGQTYNSAWVSCNGFLTFFEGDVWAFGNIPIPNPSYPNAAIYAFWDDMLVGPEWEGYNPGGSVRTELVGEAPNRRFVVEWRNLRILGRDQVMDVEIVLFENGRILTQYRNVPDDAYYRGLDATLGLEDDTGTIALPFSYAESIIISPEFAVLYQLAPGGFLQGHVIDAADGLPITGAAIVVSDPSGVVRSLTTDADGFYRTRVPLGQYTIEASAPRYTPASATVMAETEDATYEQDFALQAPGAMVEPTSLVFSVPAGQSRSQTLTLRNTGSLDLVWEISEGGGFAADFNSGLPAGTTLYGSAYIGAGGVEDTPALHLTDAFVYSSYGLWVVDELTPGTPVTDFTATFKMLIGNGDAADGLSFNFAPYIPDVYARDWEEGTGSGLSVCFDTWNNWGVEAPAIDVKVDDQQVGWQPVDLAFLRQGRFVDVSIAVTPEHTLTLNVDNQTIFSDLPVPGTPSAGRFAFGARTGGASDNHWVDNLSITIPLDAPWLMENPTSGTVSAGAAQPIEVTVDASALEPGVYATALTILNNSARAPRLTVPVTVSVSMVYLQGHVRDANNGLPIAGANVIVFKTSGEVVRNLTTDDSGFYRTQIPMGEYVIAASAENYSPELATLTANVQDETYIRDFALRTVYLQGTVTDFSDGQPIVGAQVLVYQDGNLVRQLYTDGYGFYFTQLPPGQYDIQASANRYTTESATLTLESRQEPYVQNFALQAPGADVSPTSMEFRLAEGQSSTRTLTLRNSGSLDLVWEMTESGGKKILRTTTAAYAQAPNYDPDAQTSQGLFVEPDDLLAPDTLGDIMKSWTPAGIGWVWGVGYNGNVWLSDSQFYYNRSLYANVEFTVDGAATGAKWRPDWAGAWAGDMAFNTRSNWMCQVNVGGDNGIYCWDPATGTVMASIKGSFPWTTTSQRGLAYRPDNDTFYIGGWNQGIIYHIKGLSWDHPGQVLNSFYPRNGNGYERAISGLGWDSRRNILWEASNSYYDTIYALNPDTGVVLSMLPHPTPYYNGAGLEVDPNGNLWMVSQGWRMVYLIDTSTDVRWLTENPTSGTLAAGESQIIDVTADSSGLQPGLYAATLTISNNSGRTPKLTVPVTLAVSLAFLQGHVTDANNGSPIAGASVRVFKDGTMMRSLRTDASGFYQTQVPMGTYTVQASVYGYSTESAIVAVATQDATYTQDFALRTAYLQGHVTDLNTGQPMPGATVVVYQDGNSVRWLYTDWDGFYFTQLPPGQYIVEASAWRYTTESATLTLESRLEPYTQDFVLGTAYLQGQVTDFNTGQPIPWATVVVYHQDGWIVDWLQPDWDGYYYTQLWPGQYVVEASAWRYTTESAALTLESRLEPYTQDFALGTAYLQGQVTDFNTGQPIPWATVVVYHQDGWIVDWLQTDWDGYYYTQLWPGQYVVEASAWAYSTESATVTLESRLEPYIENLALRTAYLQGHVTDANNGLPIADATVFVYDINWWWYSWLTTDAAGFYFTQLPPGQYVVEASAWGYSTESANLTVESRQEPYVQDFVLRTAYLRGQVTDANDKLPVVGATVLVSDANGEVRSLETDVNGGYFTQLPPGQYLIQASANRYSTESATVTLESRPESELPPGWIRRSPLADSIVDWSTTAQQGNNGWYNGYYDLSLDEDGLYQPDNFTLFPHDGAGWSPTDFWDGTGWDWFNGNPPWTEMYREHEHPNSPNGWGVDPGNPATHEHWVIRRWTSTVPGNLNLTCRLKFRKASDACGGDGVTVCVFREGTMVYSNAIYYYDMVGRDDLIYLPDVMQGERIDIALAPGNTDYCDSTFLSATIFARPAATVQDLALRTPLAMAAPASLRFVVMEGQAKTLLLTLQNLGGLDLTWKLRDSAASQVVAPQGTGTRLIKWEPGLSMTNNAGGESLAYPTAFSWQPAQPSADLNILIYADDYYHYAPYTYLDQALQHLGLPYLAYYNAYWSGFEAALASRTWDIVLVGNDNWYPPTSTLNALNNYVLGGGKLVYHGWTVGYYNYGDPLWTTLGFNFVGNDYDPPDPVYWWEPDHMIFTDPESVPEFTALSWWRYGIYGQYVEPMAGFDALAGYTTPGPDPNQAALIVGNGGRTVFKGFLDGQNDADLDADGIPDGAELWMNLIAGIQIGFSSDLPWLTEDPTSGTLAPNQPHQIRVIVDARGLQPGEYSATLTIRNNSGRIQKLIVPVSVKVVPYRAAVNAGGPNYTDLDGEEWSADQAWGGSGWGHVGTSGALSSTTPVAGTPDPKLYATARQGQFEYRFDVPRPGVYKVDLRFAEIQNLKPTYRVFDVEAEGTTVLAAHDIAAEAGKSKADNHSCSVNVTDAQLNIKFIPRPNKKPPIINAIRVLRLPDP